MDTQECQRAFQAYKQEQMAAWGSVDDMIIARYLAGESTSEERKAVELEMSLHPKLAEGIIYIQKME